MPCNGQYGYLRVKPQYLKVPDQDNPQASDFDQELLIEPIHNPNLVTPDAASVKPDGSDMRHCTIEEVLTHDRFTRDYPDAKIRDFATEHMSTAPAWVRDKTITVANHWRIDTTTKRLLLVRAKGDRNGRTEAIWKGDLPGKLPDDIEIARERDVEIPQVRMYLTNGVELLDTTDWPGRYIPVVACYGKVLYLTQGGRTKRVMLSLPRLARDPAMLYCYIRTCEAEAIGGVPRATFVGYEGQFRGHENDWAKANHEPVPYLEAKATTEATGQNALPLPQRQPWDPPLQNLEIAAESARRAIQSAIGSTPLPTAAQRRNEKSGVALKQIEFTTQKGQFHFIDHFEEALTRTFVILDDLLPHYDDTARDVTVRGQDGESSIVRINDPAKQDSVWLKDQQDKVVGLHDVTLSTGPSKDSEREAANDFADQLATVPQLMAVIGDLVVKLKNLGPVGDEIAERLTPPQYRKPKDGASPDPAQMQQELATAKGQLQQLQQVAQEMKQALDTEQAKQGAQVKIKEMDLAFQREKMERDSETKITVAELGAKVDRLTLFLEERARVGMQMHEAEQADLGRRHEAVMTMAGQQHEDEQADAEHQRSLEAADVQHRQALEAQDAATQGQIAVQQSAPAPGEEATA